MVSSLTFKIFSFLFFRFTYLCLFSLNLEESETFSISDCDSFFRILRNKPRSTTDLNLHFIWNNDASFIIMFACYFFLDATSFINFYFFLVMDGCNLFPLNYTFWSKTQLFQHFFFTTAGYSMYIPKCLSWKKKTTQDARNIRTRGSYAIFTQ